MEFDWWMNKVDLKRMLVCIDGQCYCNWKNIRVKNKKISPSLCQWFIEENAALAQCTMVWWVEEHYFKTLVICCVLCLWFIAPNLEYHHPLNVIELLQKYAKNYHTDSCSRFSEIRIKLIQMRPWDNHIPPVNLSTLGLLDIWAFPLDLGPWDLLIHPHTSWTGLSLTAK